jgi:hypothetical protein
LVFLGVIAGGGKAQFSLCDKNGHARSFLLRPGFTTERAQIPQCLGQSEMILAKCFVYFVYDDFALESFQ